METQYALKQLKKETIKDAITVGCIKNLELPNFTGINLIIGDNNCGKSTLIKYLSKDGDAETISTIDDFLQDTSRYSVQRKVDEFLDGVKKSICADNTFIIATNNSDAIDEMLKRGVKTFRLGNSGMNRSEGDTMLVRFERGCW